MEKRGKFRAAAFFFLAALAAVMPAGCSRRSAGAAAPPPAEPDPWPGGENIIAILRPGPAPIWFELGPGAPVHIPAPGDASLIPWLPWTGSRFVAAFLPQNGRLVMAVNQEGFLVFLPPRNGDIPLCRVDAGDAWDSFTAGAAFCLPGSAGGDAVAFLYQDTVFYPEQEGAWRLLALSPDSFSAAPRRFPALDPPGGPWNLTILRQGRDGFWHFRAAKAGGAGGIAYFRARDFDSAAETVNVGVFRNAMTPYNKNGAPAPLRELLEAAAGLAESGQQLLARILFQDSGGAVYRSFSVTAGSAGFAGGGRITELTGFYGPERPGDITAALLHPDGRLLYRGGERTGSLSLPVLPEAFVWTGAGPAGAGNVVFAWEEQQDSSVASAGFMVMALPFSGAEAIKGE